MEDGAPYTRVNTVCQKRQDCHLPKGQAGANTHANKSEASICEQNFSI